MNLFFVCKETNSFYNDIKNQYKNTQRFNSIKELINNLTENCSILILADNYPILENEISSKELNLLKPYKVYIEYPKQLGDMTFSNINKTIYERMIITDNCFSPSISLNDLLMLNECYYIDLPYYEKSIAKLAKVAGYDKIAFNIPEDATNLLSLINSNLLVSATCLSNFREARFSPFLKAQSLINEILKFLGADKQFSFEPYVNATYNKNHMVNENDQKKAIKRGLDWFNNYMLCKEEIGLGVLEGYSSEIGTNGGQTIHNVIRCDCILESSLVFACDFLYSNNPKSLSTAKKLLDYGFSDDFFISDSSKNEYGLLNWFKNKKVFYGDDNARALLGALASRAIIDDGKWDEKILKCILANYRTSDKDGLRYRYIRDTSLADGWEKFYNATEKIDIHPHFQCYMWSVYLWAYKLTDFEGFYNKARNGIKRAMEEGIENWRWTNSLSCEIARMLLPLSFLYNIEPSLEHKKWLYTIIDELEKLFHHSGGIYDMFGDIKKGKYPPPTSNENYGTTEASIIQENGDGATDLLYTTNWAFLGLYESYMITKDEKIKKLCDKLSDFLVKIQIKSEKFPYLDGAWMRSFDFEKWEYYGSSADKEWGAWCIESGWTNSWILSVFYMRILNKAFMTHHFKDDFKKDFEKIKNEMLGNIK